MAHAWKACWVQALGGSNPPSSATGPRDRFRFRGFCVRWSRLRGVLSACVCPRAATPPLRACGGLAVRPKSRSASLRVSVGAIVTGAAAREGGKRVCWGPVLRVTVSSEPPQGRNAARIRVRCRVRGGSLSMLLDSGRLQDAHLPCGSSHIVWFCISMRSV